MLGRARDKMSLAVRDPDPSQAPASKGLVLPAWHALSPELAILPPNTAPLMTSPVATGDGISLFANLPADGLRNEPLTFASPVFPGDTVRLQGLGGSEVCSLSHSFNSPPPSPAHPPPDLGQDCLQALQGSAGGVCDCAADLLGVP